MFLFLRILKLLRAALQTIQTCRIAHLSVLPEPLDRVYRHCRETLDMPDVQLLFSHEFSGPITIGRAIVLPNSMLTERSADVLTTAAATKWRMLSATISGQTFCLIFVVCMPSPRELPRCSPPIEYGSDFLVRRVKNHGEFGWNNEHVFISTVGKYVAR